MAVNEEPKSDALLLVDYENVQALDLSSIPDGMRVRIFVGSNQTRIPISMVQNAQRLGSRVEWIRCENAAPNALDFMIACSLGREIERSPKVAYTILSKDHGFDPLVKHLTAEGVTCRRINSQTELRGSAPPNDTPEFQKVFDTLKKSQKNARPRKRETLAKHIANILHKPVDSAEIGDIIDLLFRKELITEAAGAVTYAF